LVAAGTASGLAERFDESNGVLNGVGALRRNLAQKAHCKGVVGRLRAIADLGNPSCREGQLLGGDKERRASLMRHEHKCEAREQ